MQTTGLKLQPTACNVSALISQPRGTIVISIIMQHSRHAYETHAYLPTYFAVTLCLYTLIPTVYRALLKNAVSGTDHRIHTTKMKWVEAYSIFYTIFLFAPPLASGQQPTHSLPSSHTGYTVHQCLQSWPKHSSSNSSSSSSSSSSGSSSSSSSSSNTSSYCKIYSSAR